MKSILVYFILSLLLSSCTHRIVRSGYQISNSDNDDCNVIIKKFMHVTDSIQKIGEIKLGESGFAVACSEAHAIKILNNEACAIQADVINIVEENRPDFWSSCYRCRAEFYKYKISPVQVQSNELYNQDSIKKRVSQDRGKNTVIAIMAVVAGILISTLLFQ
jgi:hypothetical protein